MSGASSMSLGVNKYNILPGRFIMLRSVVQAVSSRRACFCRVSAPLHPRIPLL